LTVPGYAPAPALANCGNVSTGSVSEVTLYAPAAFSGLPGASPSGPVAPESLPEPVKDVTPGVVVRE
jgi:hypothetical protein